MIKLIDAESVVGAMDLCIALIENTMDTENKEVLAILRAYQNIRECINEWPSIAVEPARKKGRWIEIEVWPERYDIFGVKTWASEMQCNQCGFRHTAIQGHMAQYNFCPSCGADMRGEK